MAEYVDFEPGQSSSDRAVFLWERERAFSGYVETVIQGDKDCAGIVWAQACYDWLMQKTGQAKRISSEVLYTGSRSVIGKGHLGASGCYLSWVARFIQYHGVVVRGVFPPFDFSTYNPAFVKEYSRQALPYLLTSQLRPLHTLIDGFHLPEPKIGCLTDPEKMWQAVGGGFSLPFACKDGFSFQRDKRGVCSINGKWDHALLVRGRCILPCGTRCFVVQNSLGDYLGTVNNVVFLKSGRQVELPSGFFLVTFEVFASVVSRGEVFVIC